MAVKLLGKISVSDMLPPLYSNGCSYKYYTFPNFIKINEKSIHTNIKIAQVS